ncbi:apolipoprotein N-acyltransferase [Kordiimonas aquimaris]|uniref:apolipoprotein N-acyltransferase n=1 Tax=Kordiimonas aquimaris TaxID=707591 RepID=UPI0021D2827C|nr:apolipoprotein N-acyltransferase [Kordiimonas aquimaris]
MAAQLINETGQSDPAKAGRFDLLFVRLAQWLSEAPSWRFPIIAFILGFLVSRGFAPVNFFPAIFVAIPLMIFLIDQVKSGRQAFAVGWWVGFGLFSVGLTWIGHSFTQQDNVPVILAPFAIFALAGLMAIYVGLSFWVCWRLWVPSAWRILLFASVWLLFEFARGYLFTGFPWHLVGTIWADWLPVAQLASLGTVYGLSGLTVLAAAVPAAFIGVRRTVPGSIVSLVPLAALIIGAFWGQARLESGKTSFELGVSLKLVQANVRQREKWLSHLIDDHFDKHMSLSRGGNEKGKAEGTKLLIWPETAVQRENFDREGSLLRWRMSRVLDFGAYAITGAPRYERTDAGIKFYNSLIAFNSRGQLYARYDKRHLVPFGEYLPFEGLLQFFGLSQLTGGSAFSSGTGMKTYGLPGVPSFTPMICYEIIFPGRTPTGKDRPGWLLNITNDGWFGVTNGPYQHLGLARFRAIEEGLPVIRSASTGVSAVIDAYGRTVSSLSLDKQGVLDSPLPHAIEAPAYNTSLKLMLTFGLTAFVALMFAIAAFVRLRNQHASAEL